VKNEAINNEDRVLRLEAFESMDWTKVDMHGVGDVIIHPLVSENSRLYDIGMVTITADFGEGGLLQAVHEWIISNGKLPKLIKTTTK